MTHSPKITQHIPYFLLLTSTTFIDSLVQLIILWQAITHSNNIALLGGVLCLSCLLPYFLQNIPIIQKLISSYTYYTLFIVRVLLTILLIVGGYWLNIKDIYSLYGLALFTNLMCVLTTQLLEVVTASMVLDKKISNHHAARMMQLSTKIGIMLGVGIGSFTLKVFCPKSILLGAGLLSLLISGRLSLFRNKKSTPPIKQNLVQTAHRASKNKVYLLLLFLTLFLQTQSFNFLFPILIRKEWIWGPEILGIIEISSSIACILAIFGPFTSGQKNKYIAIGLGMLFNLTIAYTSLIWLIIVVDFFTSFFFTLNRLSYQQSLYASYQNRQEASKWSAHMAYNTVLIKGGVPLIFGYIIGQGVLPSSCFLGLAMVVPFSLIVFSYLCKRASK